MLVFSICFSVCVALAKSFGKKDAKTSIREHKKGIIQHLEEHRSFKWRFNSIFGSIRGKVIPNIPTLIIMENKT